MIFSWVRSMSFERLHQRIGSAKNRLYNGLMMLLWVYPWSCLWRHECSLRRNSFEQIHNISLVILSYLSSPIIITSQTSLATTSHLSHLSSPTITCHHLSSPVSPVVTYYHLTNESCTCLNCHHQRWGECRHNSHSKSGHFFESILFWRGKLLDHWMLSICARHLNYLKTSMHQ